MELTLEQFIEFYRSKKYFPLNISNGKAKYNDRELQSKYKKYQGKLLKDAEKFKTQLVKTNNARKVIPDDKWLELKEVISLRDHNNCRLYKVLTKEEKLIIISQLQKPFDILDGAHVLSRARRPDLKYDRDNVVLLHRLFHSRIDTFRNPVTSEPISEEERVGWWKRIVGEDLYNDLCNR